MAQVAIQAERLSKQYLINAEMHRHDTLADQLAEQVRSLFRRRTAGGTGKRQYWALQDVSFKVRQGEVVGIIGHNGAGKSTLLKILSRITRPSSGRAELFGRVGSLLEVGTGFHPELTGRENIYLNGAVIGMKRQEISRRFDEIVDFSEVGPFLDMPVKRYSSGMYVRLAFAVAAHLEPEILLVDEVLAVGDGAFQKKCLGKIGSVAQGGRTVIFISHNMNAVNSLCDRVLWVDKGKIADDGPSAQVVASYLSAATDADLRTEEIWEDKEKAPGSDCVRLRRIRLLQQDGNSAEPLTMQTPFGLEIEFWNLVSGRQLHTTIHLYTQEGIIAFTTGSQQSEPMAAGLYRSTGYFPGNLLNSGIHRFVLLIVRDGNTVVFRHESRIPVAILDLRQSCFSYGREPGVVQPVLKWKTECISLGSSDATLPENAAYHALEGCCP